MQRYLAALNDNKTIDSRDEIQLTHNRHGTAKHVNHNRGSSHFGSKMTLAAVIKQWGLPPCHDNYCELCHLWVHPGIGNYRKHLQHKKHQRQRKYALYILLAIASEP